MMKKFLSFLTFSALTLTMSAAMTTVHKGQGMSGDDAYSEMTFTCGQPDKPDATATARYTMTATSDSKLSVNVKFENLEPATFVGLVDAAYMIIDGIGETPLTLADGAYTATTTQTFTEGQTYTGFFKRMSAGDWYGGDLFFYFEFTYTKDGAVDPEPPVEPVVEQLNPTFTTGAIYFAPGWAENNNYTATFNDGVFDLTLNDATFERWQAQFSLMTDIVPSADYYYTLAFDIVADKDFNNAYYKLFPQTFDNDMISDLTMDLKANQSQRVVKGGKGFTNEQVLRLLFDFGANPAGINIRISNIKIYRSNVVLTQEPGSETPVDPEQPADPVVEHKGNTMSGDEAYTQVKFPCHQTGKPAATATARYTMTATEDSRLGVSVTFEGLDPATFIGLVDEAYLIIAGIGETPLTLADGVYTATTEATFAEGQTYTGFFKRMSSPDYYGAVLEFPFEFTYTNGGETPVDPDQPTEPVVGHKGDGLSSYTEVTFPASASSDNKPFTVRVNYELTNGANGVMTLTASFDGLDETKITGLVEGAYLIIDGVGETALTPVASRAMATTYTAEINGLSDNTTYEARFKRLSAFGDMNFPLSFTYADTSAIDSIVADGTDAPVEYFSLQGVKIQNPAAGTIVIRRQGLNVTKIRF